LQRVLVLWYSALDVFLDGSGLSSLRDVARRVELSPTVLPWRSRYIPQMAYFVTATDGLSYHRMDEGSAVARPSPRRLGRKRGGGIKRNVR
jgi:hypothetical protein